MKTGVGVVKERLERVIAPLRERAQAQFDQLQPRERTMVSVGVVVVALLIVYVGIWKPASLARTHAEQRLQDARELAAQLEHAGAQIPRNPVTRGPSGGSLLSVVDQAAKGSELGKPLSRLSPDSDKQVRAWVEGVPFDSLLHWIYTLQTRYGVRVDTADIERQPTEGLVNARLSLVRAP